MIRSPETVRTLGPPPDSDASVTVRPCRSWAEAVGVWRHLYDSRPDASVFLSPEWLEAWLEVFGDNRSPELLVFVAEHEAVAVCALMPRPERRGPFRLRALYINGGGEDSSDRSAVEFNDILCVPGHERGVARALRAHLDGRVWDEIVAYGFRRGPLLEALDTGAFADLPRDVHVRPSFYVDLERLRATGRTYDDALSRNKRWQIRKFARMYEPLGPLRIEVGRDAAHAEGLFDQLIGLHQRSWAARGHRGAFASPRKVAFHRTLITRAFPQGAIQFLRVAAGEHTVGILYNFVRQGRVDFYQSGFNYQEGFRPGYVTFVTAIRYCLDHGFCQFDFLAGDQQYKQSLSTDVHDLVWAAYRRNSFKMRSIDWLQRGRDAIVRSWRRVRGPRPHGPENPEREGGSAARRTHRAEPQDDMTL
jgi:CelD/BcsL family acetyltransferase involved in cellulose biosynthesis